MPIYEFECQKCEHWKEILSSKAKKSIKCPNCKGKMKRVMSGSSAHFKGAGFHSTDYPSGREDRIKKEMQKAGYDYDG